MLKRLISTLFARARSGRAQAANRVEADVVRFLQRAIEVQKSGDDGAAMRILREGIAAHPLADAAHVYLAELLRTSSRDAEARDCYERAIALAPQQAEVSFNYAAVLERLGEDARAEIVCRQVIEQRPDWPEPILRCGFIVFRRGDFAPAYALFQRAIALAPESATARLGAGMALMNLEQPSEAIGHFRLALERDPCNGEAFRQLCTVQFRLGDDDALRSTLTEHRRAAGSADGASILRALAVPSLFDSVQEIRQIRARLQSEIDGLARRRLAVGDPSVDVGVTNFNLAYQGEDDREIQEKIAALHLHACPGLRYVAPHCSGWHSRSAGRIRVGIASTFLHDHSIGRVVRGLFAQLDRSRVSVHGFAFQSKEDPLYLAMKRDADEWVTLPRDFAVAREALAGAQLDVLLYPDIGMDPLTYFLSFARLAPVQCTTWGHPVTSGVPALDYFISTDYFESPGSESHYSERLVCLRDVAFPGYYLRPPEVRAATAPGFDRGRRVYFCPQVLFKLHPDFDPIIADILRRDRGGEVVITHNGAYDAHRLKRLQARLQGNAPDVFDRIVFLPRTPGADGYIQRMRACDVVLDTVHYCGGNTSLEAILTGAPVVTLPSALQRGRHTYGFFRKMDFMDTVVQSAGDYAQLAVRIASDKAFAVHLRQTQAARASALYEDSGAVRQIEDFFERALAGAGAN